MVVLLLLNLVVTFTARDVSLDHKEFVVFYLTYYDVVTLDLVVFLLYLLYYICFIEMELS